MTPGTRRFATRAVRGVAVPPPRERAVAPPLYQTSTFAFDDDDAFAAALRDADHGFAYTRYGNPTTASLEAAMADLEGGSAALAFASGMGAISTVLLTLAGAAPPRRVVASTGLYGGTYSLLNDVVGRLGIDVVFVDADDPDAVAAALAGGAAVVYAETIVNPTMAVTDLPRLADAAHRAGATFVVDNTVASPVLCRPLEHGADVVVHSATKYLGGHSDVVGGVAVFADPALRHTVWTTSIDLGASLDPFAAWLILRGLRTLPLRVERHCENAGAVAAFLAGRADVERVYWPAAAGHPSRDVAARLLSGGGGLLSFDLAGGRAAGRAVVEAVQVWQRAASLGGVESLVAHPATTTHRQLDDRALAAAGIGPGMLRLAVGIEDVRDLVDDLAQALDAAAQRTG